MRSFAVVAGFAAAANAYAYGYEAYNTTSVAPPSYATSSAPAYPAYPPPAYGGYTTTTIKGLTTVCPGSTTLTVGTKTYTVTKSTTIIDDDCIYTTTMPVKSTPTPIKLSTPAVKYSSIPVYVKPSSAPAPPVKPTPIVPYPSKNGTAPTYPVATGVPTSTKPAPPQFTGAAAGQAGAAVLAVAAAGIAALL